MKFRSSLRVRVTLSFALLGAVVSAVLSGGLYLLTLQMEQRLVAETLSTELEDYMARHALDPDTPPPSSTRIRAYVLSPGSALAVPAVLYDLPAGLHRIDHAGRGYFAEVRQRAATRFAILLDDSGIRHREAQFRAFLGGGLLLMTLVSALLGWWLAQRVIYPVSELARRVAALSPQAGADALAGDFPDDEVGELARGFDAYQHRLAEFVERERAFTGDVSHELRTPLAVIEGAAEVLLANPQLDEDNRRRVERIARAVHEASELTEALLMLAREEDGKALRVCECAVEDVLRQVIEGQSRAPGSAPVPVRLEIEGRPVLATEPGLLRIVLGNLVRNACAYTSEGSIVITLQDGGVTIADTGVGMSDDQLARVFERHYSGNDKGGAGIGLSIVKRICRRYGWNIAIASEPGAGTTIRLSFL